ncbi:decaprenyl-phosphate phosphoribosyltransferase [Oscillibacter valericigenes]|nr:decaprenyl-phosphate phosphoribosyltransferase [Oscillibacter valericigenes]
METEKKSGIKLRKVIKLMRPKHYLKNALVFVSLFFTGNLLNLRLFGLVFVGTIAFCLISSVVYIVNDIHDVEEDRQHEVKRFRPIASGDIPISVAYAIAAVCFALAVGINLAVICTNTETSRLSLLILITYFATNLGYSLGLKNVPFLDICLLVLGFLLRLLYGATLIGAGVSSWVYLTVLSLSFYLGLGKRRNEIKKVISGKSRKVLKYYTVEFLDRFMYVCLTLSIVFYSLWSADSQIIEKYGTDKLVWTVPVVIVLLMKYTADVESDSFGDPVDVVTKDHVLLGLAVAFCVLLAALVYLPTLR